MSSKKEFPREGHFNKEIADKMYCELKEWCKANRMPLMSADEILASEYMSQEQHDYLLDYIQRWEYQVYNITW